MEEEIKVEKSEEEMLKELNDSIEELMPAINGSVQVMDEAVNEYLAGLNIKDYSTPVWIKFINTVGCMFIVMKLSGVALVSAKKIIDEDGFSKILGVLMERVIVTFEEEFTKVCFDAGEESKEIIMKEEDREDLIKDEIAKQFDILIEKIELIKEISAAIEKLNSIKSQITKH